MGKLRKVVVDRIRDLSKAGYTDAEVAEELGISRKSVAKYKVGGDSSFALRDYVELSLSDGLMRRLFDVQGLLGSPTIDDALETVYKDELAAMQFKMTSWKEYSFGDGEFTVEALINNLLKHIEYLESELKIHEEGYVKDRETIENLKKQLARARALSQSRRA